MWDSQKLINLVYVFLPDSKTEGFCQQLLIAFLNGMSDTEGKVVMSKLLERIICDTKMAMSVVCTGGGGHIAADLQAKLY